ncbi:MAG: selenide, water dikinase SelD [Solirubrobacteraceae bacterium]
MIDEPSGLSTPPAPRLTSFARGAGCGCKLPAAELHQLLRDLPAGPDDGVLVGFQGGDDAAVVQIADDTALVQTVDFFTPVVDDPFEFGAIAAANALSDVYAMGGRPISALSVVGFPLERLGADVLRAVMRGALVTLGEAGVPLVGGHSIDDPEPKFGLAVTGLVDPRRIMRNCGARIGDVLVLTKPLGTGAIVTRAQRAGSDGGGSDGGGSDSGGSGGAGFEGAGRNGDRDDDALAAAIQVMRTLNDVAGRQAVAARAHAATDVTGFGLLGHLHGMARESEVSVRVRAAAVPALDHVADLLAREGGISGGTRRNAAWSESFTSFDDVVPAWQRWLLNDATTSGGLLVAVDPAAAPAVSGAVIGRVIDGAAGTIHVG